MGILLFNLWPVISSLLEPEPDIKVYAQHFDKYFVIHILNNGNVLDKNILLNIQVENRIDSIRFRQKNGIEIIEAGTPGSNYVIFKIYELLPTLSYSAFIYTNPSEIYKIKIRSNFFEDIPYSGFLTTKTGIPQSVK